MYNYRYLQDNLSLPPANFRAVLITGPRRSGKSTFAKHLLKLWGGEGYITFDTPLEQARFKTDPEGFLKSLRTPAVLDEVQNIPEVFNYLKVAIDANPDEGCEYILTGSQHFQMMHRVSESLAGRILVKELLPFSLGEAHQTPSSRIKSNIEKLLGLSADFDLGAGYSVPPQRPEVVELLHIGGFPPSVLADTASQRSEWFNSYVETYVQRDVRALSNIQDLSSFSRFVTLIAGRTSQTINFSELGKDIGLNYKTTQHYLSLLEASYLWKTLVPYYKGNSEKRLSKSPKGIFTDTGLAMFLLGLHREGLERNPLFGSLFETLVVGELQKLCAAYGFRVTFCHFKAGNRAEVDLVIEHGSTIIPIEIKCSASPDPTWGKGIRILRQATGLSEQHPAFIISLVPELKQISPKVFNVPLRAFY